MAQGINDSFLDQELFMAFLVGKETVPKLAIFIPPERLRRNIETVTAKTVPARVQLAGGGVYPPNENFPLPIAEFGHLAGKVLEKTFFSRRKRNGRNRFALKRAWPIFAE